MYCNRENAFIKVNFEQESARVIDVPRRRREQDLITQGKIRFDDTGPCFIVTVTTFIIVIIVISVIIIIIIININ